MSPADTTSKPQSPVEMSIDVEEPIIDGITYTTIQEGLAKILLPKASTDRQVFYNPVQQFNRDLTITVIKGFAALYQSGSGRKKRSRGGKHGKRVKLNGHSNVEDTEGVNGLEEKSVPEVEGETGRGIEEEEEKMVEDVLVEPVAKDGDLELITEQPPPEPTKPKPRFAILDALSASGLRANRYALEMPFVTTITANDMDPRAVESMSRNIAYNKTDSIVKPQISNAIAHMYRVAFPENHGGESKKYHVIDLDPYGTAAPFLDAAVQAVEDGGLLAVTCTDAGVFASTAYPEKCFSLYGGLPVKGDYSHEVGIRIILFAIATTAGKYGLIMEPLLSLSIDFYARVFVRIRKSPEGVKMLASKCMLAYSCGEGCGSWKIQRLGTAKERKPGGAWKYGIAKAPGENQQTCEHCGFKTHVSCQNVRSYIFMLIVHDCIDRGSYVLSRSSFRILHRSSHQEYYTRNVSRNLSYTSTNQWHA